MALAPAAFKTDMISSRPVLASWSGKKPRLPTTIPKVMVRGAVISSLLLDAAILVFRLVVAPGAKADAVKKAERQQESSPPNRRMQVGQDHGGGLPADELKDSVAKNQGAINGEQED